MDSLLSLAPRERILHTASRLFYSQGYHATGINQLIAEAQVAKASFYTHFTSKDELAVAYLEQVQAERMRHLRAVVEVRPPGRARVLALFDFLDQWLPETEYRGCRSLRLLPEFPDPTHPAHRQIVAYKASLRAYIATLVADVEPAAGSTQDVTLLAAQVYLLFEGALLESALFREAWPIEVARAATERLLT